MWTFIYSLNSREKAIATWLLLLLVLLLFKENVRLSILGVIKAFFNKKIISVVLGMLIYASLIVVLLFKIGLWDASLIKDTIFWILGTALVLLMNTNKATENISFFKETVIKALKLIVVLEFIVNFYTFNFGVEMLFVPLLVVIGGMSALAEVKLEYKQIKKLIDSILSTIGIFLIVYALSKVISDFQSLATLHNLRAFVLPPLLTLAYMPFLYLFALVMAYEILFVRLDIFLKKDKELAGYTKWKIFTLCYLDLGKLNKFAQSYARETVQLTNRGDVRDMIKKFKHRK